MEITKISLLRINLIKKSNEIQMNRIPIKLVYIKWFNSKENGSGNVIDFMKRSLLAGFDGIIVRRNINYMFLNGLVIVFLIL